MKYGSTQPHTRFRVTQANIMKDFANLLLLLYTNMNKFACLLIHSWSDWATTTVIKSFGSVVGL